MNRAEKILISCSILNAVLLIVVATLLFRIEQHAQTTAFELQMLAKERDLERKQRVNEMLRQNGLPEVETK